MRYFVSWILFVVCLFLLILAYWMRMGGEVNAAFRTLFYLAVPWTAFVCALIAAVQYGKGSLRPVFWTFAAGLLCYGIAEGLWLWYDLILQVDPFPSLADAFYLGAYPFFFAGIVWALRQAEFSWKMIHPSTRFLLALIVALAGIFEGYFGIYQGYQPSLPVLDNVISMSYSVADFFLLMFSLLVLILAWEYRGGKLMRFWLWVFVACLTTLAADIGFSMFYDAYLGEEIIAVNALDSLWILSYLFFALAMTSVVEYIQNARAQLNVSRP